MAATIAGDPKPCVIREKLVRVRWTDGSRIGVGRVLPSGDRSWFNRSTSSFTTCLQHEYNTIQYNINLRLKTDRTSCRFNLARELKRTEILQIKKEIRETEIEVYNSYNIKPINLEACPLNKSQIASLDFVINRFFMKLFNTNNMEIIKACQSYFSFKLPSALIPIRVNKFTARTNAIWDFSGFFPVWYCCFYSCLLNMTILRV